MTSPKNVYKSFNHLKKYYYSNIYCYYSIHHMLSLVCFRVAKNPIVFWLFNKNIKEMCIYISMSIIEKVFKYEATELPVIKYEDEIWFKAVVVATILKYTNQRKAIRDHVDPEDKRKLSELVFKTKRNESTL